jgi:hypothetical protein
MDISTLAKKPQLTKIVIADQDLVSKYGEEISFWILDEMDVKTYFDFYKFQQSQDSELLNSLLRKLILKEDGAPAIAVDQMLPVDLTLAVLVEINNFLGKSDTQPKAAKSESETGAGQS